MTLRGVVCGNKNKKGICLRRKICQSLCVQISACVFVKKSLCVEKNGSNDIFFWVLHIRDGWEEGLSEESPSVRYHNPRSAIVRESVPLFTGS